MILNYKNGIWAILVLALLVFSSCSVLRKRDCDCPQWSKENADNPSNLIHPNEPAV
jgi:hypothetical protein